MPSVTDQQHSFARIPSAEIQRSVFDRSCGLKTTFNAGYLIPIFCDEALPGDTMHLNARVFGRLGTLMRPIMDNLFLDFFFFAVPNRLLWSNWKKLNGEQASPGASTDFLVPVINSPASVGFAEGSIYDYLGVPTKVAGIAISALWCRAYNLIYNEWFRDQNLIASTTVPLTDGPDSASTYGLLRRGKRHDYFTSALPWPQKGTAVGLPLGTYAPVVASGTSLLFSVGGTNLELAGGSSAGTPTFWKPATSTGGSPSATYVGGLRTDLSAATAATINQLREAFQIQRLFERDARGGTRYTEVIKSHFGVSSPDQRQQRPEYLGGGTARINVNPVPSTFYSEAAGAEVAIAEMGAFGTVSAARLGFSQSFTEHCVILGLACLRADLNYQQGLERMWSRRKRFDFYWPALAHLGEQEVLSREIFCDGTANDTTVFGYQERYAEYRYKPSRVTGRFRSNSAQKLDSWHLAQNFATRPLLNEAFIQEDPPLDRVIAVTQSIEPQMQLDAFFEFRCARPMPVYGVPGLIDHF